MSAKADPRSAAPTAEIARPDGAMARRGALWIAATILVFALLVALRAEILRSPPYFETALGFYREALFLAETDFDYERLRYREVRGNDGGPYVYMTSVLPTLLAVAIRNVPTREDAFLAIHLFSLAAGATLTVLVAGILWRRAGPAVAVAAALAAISTPLVVVQMDIVSLDLTMAALAVAALAAVVAGRYPLAALLAVLSFFAKATGLVATAALATYLALRLLALCYLARRAGRPLRSDADIRHTAVGLALFVLAGSLEAYVHHWGGIGNRLHAITFDESWLTHFRYLCPDFLVVATCAGAAFAVAMVAALRTRAAQLKSRTSPSWPMRIADVIVAEPLLLSAAGIAVLMALAIRVYTAVFVIRYLLILVPLAYLLLAASIGRFPRARRGLAIALALAFAFNVLNAYGYFYPEPPGNRRHCNTRERSLEYLTDHRSNIAAMRAIAAKANGAPVVAGYPFNCFLSTPQMGYVDRPLPVYATMPYLAPTVRTALEMLSDRPARLIFIDVENPSHRTGQISPPPRIVADRLIYDDQLRAPLVIYERTLPESDPAARVPWYVDHLWFDARLLAANAATLSQRAQLLSASGRPDLAARLLEACVATDPDAAGFRILLAEQLLRQGQLAPATAQLDQARRLIEAGDEANLTARLHYTVGLIAFQQNRLTDATTELQAALAADPQFAEAEFLLGAIAARGGDVLRAKEHFDATLAINPAHLEALSYQGVLAQQAGDLDAAAGWLSEALRHNPRYGTALVNLAAIRSLQKRPDLARLLLQTAVESDPRNVAAVNELANLLQAEQDDAGAAKLLRGAVAVLPEWRDGQRRLAWLLATSWDAGTRAPTEAETLARALVAQQPDIAALDTLAASLAAQGRFDEAAAESHKALQLLAAQAPAAVRQELQSRLDLYRQQRAYRAPTPLDRPGLLVSPPPSR